MTPVEFVEQSRGTSPPHITELELDTLKSASVMHADAAVASKTSPREIALWSLAAVVAIILGVLPALWINRWRAESAAAPRAETTQPQAAATDDEPEPETIDMTAEPTVETPSLPGASAPASKTSKPHRPKTERVKQAPPRKGKQPPPCDVYLHPKGCPR